MYFFLQHKVKVALTIVCDKFYNAVLPGELVAILRRAGTLEFIAYNTTRRMRSFLDPVKILSRNPVRCCIVLNEKIVDESGKHLATQSTISLKA